MMSYYPLPPVGAYTGYIPGASPYVAGGGYSTGAPAGYAMPLPPRFHESPNSDWMTPPESQFERRHLDHSVHLGVTDWATILTTTAVGGCLVYLLMLI
ncbi:MAG: hypothetical protein LW809_05845 [Vampirovibrionales bacterium]|nr:hypothetical protein [Vampirovibrionales bacterium]